MRTTHFVSHPLLNSRKPANPFCKMDPALKLLPSYQSVASADSHQVRDLKLSRQISFVASTLSGNSSECKITFGSKVNIF